MKILGSSIGGLLVLVVGMTAGGFLGVSGTKGPQAKEDVYLFIDPYGQVQPAVSSNSIVHWAKFDPVGKTIVAVTDIKFIGDSPCAEGDTPPNGDCTVSVSDGWHPYECYDSCADPTLPVGSRTKPGGGGGGGYDPTKGANPTPYGNLPFGERVKFNYFVFAESFDEALHRIWSGDDKPVDPYATLGVIAAPPTGPSVVPPVFPNGPIARETVKCDDSGVVTVPDAETVYSGGASALVPGVTIIWDGGGNNLGSDWQIQDTGAGTHLSDVCDTLKAPYRAVSETAGFCHLNASSASQTVNYQVVVNSGSCKSGSPYSVSLSIGAAATSGHLPR